METYIIGLIEKLQKRVTELEEHPDPIHRYTNCRSLAAGCIEELNNYLASHPFQNMAAEIDYYKNTLPFFYSQYFLYTMCLQLELFRLRAGSKSLGIYIRKELKKIYRFYKRQAEFIKYHDLRSTHEDEALFVRRRLENRNLDPVEGIIDQYLCVSSYRLAWILANDQYKGVLEEELFQLERVKSGPSSEGTIKVYGFRGSGADATEVIDSWNKLHLITINGEIANLKEIKEMWEQQFSMKLGNISDRKRVNHARKKEKTPFLNKMVNILQDNKP